MNQSLSVALPSHLNYVSSLMLRVESASKYAREKIRVPNLPCNIIMGEKKIPFQVNYQ